MVKKIEYLFHEYVQQTDVKAIYYPYIGRTNQLVITEVSPKQKNYEISNTNLNRECIHAYSYQPYVAVYNFKIFLKDNKNSPKEPQTTMTRPGVLLPDYPH